MLLWYGTKVSMDNHGPTPIGACRTVVGPRSGRSMPRRVTLLPKGPMSAPYKGFVALCTLSLRMHRYTYMKIRFKSTLFYNLLI